MKHNKVAMLEMQDLCNDSCLKTEISNTNCHLDWRLPHQFETYYNKTERETQFTRFWLLPVKAEEGKRLLDGLDKEVRA